MPFLVPTLDNADPPPHDGVDKNLMCHQGEELISIIKSWPHEGHPDDPTNGNKQNCHITNYMCMSFRQLVIYGLTLSQCG